MRGTAWLALWVLLACGDEDEGDKPITDASVRIDGKVVALDAALRERCGPVTACHSGAIEQLPQLCLGSVDAQPSGDLWKVCAVDPQGRASYIQIHADERIVSPGWTYSYYGLVDGTLSDEGTDACLVERSKLIVATQDNQPDAGNVLCYRSGGVEGDD
jgi:hypothetical protein